jgi:DNA-binding XRE family transcriptional regulator
MAMQNQAPNSAPVPTTHKDYVTVVARHELGGRIRPVAYQLPDGAPVKIDNITDERQAASLKSGGQGTRYTCKVTVDEVQSDVYLFHDEELWFMEAIQAQGSTPGAESAHVQLRKARREAGLSQNEVARRLGMDVLEYCRLECGCDIASERLYRYLDSIAKNTGTHSSNFSEKKP